MNCDICKQPIMDDGYGEPIHEDTLRYGCSVVPRNVTRYPVATLPA